MIDTHIHILPNFDDGPKDLKTSLEMARIACADGVITVVATPHVKAGVYNHNKADIIEAVTNLQIQFTEHEIDLVVIPGAEYYFDADLIERAARGELLTLNDTGRYLLIEFPAAMIPEYSSRILYELQLQGITPIVAHPERNQELSCNPNILADFVSKGMYAQVTAGSITGSFGKTVQKNAEKLINAGLIHCVVSDAHSPGVRSPILSAAYKKLADAYGGAYAHSLLWENPQAIIKGVDLVPLKVKPITNGSWKQKVKQSMNFLMNI